MSRVEFFYDVGSPWTYLAFHKIEEVACTGAVNRRNGYRIAETQGEELKDIVAPRQVVRFVGDEDSWLIGASQ